MLGLVKWLHLLALSVWLGAIVFLSFVVAPSVFAAFPEAQRAEAGRIVGTIFPKYYALGYVCGGVLVATGLVLARGGGPRGTIGAAVAALMLATTVYAGLSIHPRAHALRAQLHDPAAAPTVKAEFDRLHRRAVQLNAAVLVGALALSGLAAASLRP